MSPIRAISPVPTGTRTRRVTLENPGASVPDGDGGYTTGWAPLTPPVLFARIVPATAAALERFAASTTVTTATHLVRMPYHPQVTTQSRLSFQDFHGQAHTLNVASVITLDERDQELALICVELVA